MKMTKKIALVTMFAVLACGSVFAKGKKDKTPAPAEKPAVEVPAEPYDDSNAK